MEDTKTLTSNLEENLKIIQAACASTSDVNIRQVKLAGVKTAMLTCSGMVNQQQLSEMLLDPLMEKLQDQEILSDELYSYLEARSLSTTELIETTEFSECFRLLFSGFVVFLLEDQNRALACGFAGYPYRSINSPENEVDELCAKEGFVEAIRINQTMIRRRIKSPDLQMEIMQLGEISKTDVVLVYLKSAVSKEMLKQIKKDVKKMKMPILLSSGYLKPFVSGWPRSLVSPVGLTERPDCLCGKISEGRCGILVDGVPFALIVPFLFSEHFQSMDDYARAPYYAFMMRTIKYLSFLIGILLPGLYVAVGTFHPQLFPPTLVFNIAAAQESTPFSLMTETIIMHLIYEIMREAGLRLPRSVGHAVSIVGSVVISSAAVSSGLIGGPMIMIVTLTAISGFVVPSLHEPMSLLRFLMIIIGGMQGLYGIILVSAVFGVSVCATTAYGMPYTAPVIPFTASAMRDTFTRIGYPKMQQHWAKISHLHGAHMEEEDSE